MKSAKSKLIYSLLCSAVLGLLTACNSGGTSSSNESNTVSSSNMAATNSTVDVATDDQVKTPASAYIKSNGAAPTVSSMATTTSSSCFSIMQNASGSTYTVTQNSQPYYSTATVSFTLKNTCATAQTISGLQVNVNNFTINGKTPSINYIDQAQGNPYLSFSYTTSGNNIAINLSTPSCSGAYCDWAAMPANSSRTFTINAFVNAAISSLAVASVDISGSTPIPPATGNLAVNINTSALAPVCPASTNCNISVNVLNPTGAILGIISVNPSESPNYTVTYKNLLIGNYTLAVNTNSYPSGSGNLINYTYNPSNGIAQVNSNATTNSTVTFNYTAPIQTGNLTITTGTINEAATFQNLGALAGSATDTKTKIVYSFNIGINSTVNLNNLPAGDTYNIVLQGIGDPFSGIYYSVNPVSIVVNANTATPVKLSFSKVATAQHNVTFTVTGAPANQVISFANSNASFKYNNNTLTSGTYKFLTSESAIAITLATPSGYTLTYTPM
ncbi:MAG: hypothetical protein KBD37_07595, partial [Burkholderiales bacterium]|nr:hypothetical protein [Burkholderiales bacterium]